MGHHLILEFLGQRQEDLEFKAYLVYITRSGFKNPKTKRM